MRIVITLVSSAIIPAVARSKGRPHDTSTKEGTGRRAWLEHAQQELQVAGHRAGGARAAVLDALDREPCCLTAQEIFDNLRADGRKVGIASVYRTLELLSKLHLVRRVDIGAAACYEPAHPGGEHHHHVVCERCGKVTAFEDKNLEAAIDSLGRRLKYSVGVHEVMLRGACPDCR
jgi:Fur family ferric uptake transcriptional regulator